MHHCPPFRLFQARVQKTWRIWYPALPRSFGYSEFWTWRTWPWNGPDPTRSDPKFGYFRYSQVTQAMWSNLLKKSNFFLFFSNLFIIFLLQFNFKVQQGSPELESPRTQKPKNTRTWEFENLRTWEPENPRTWEPENPRTQEPENPRTQEHENLITQEPKNLI